MANEILVTVLLSFTKNALTDALSLSLAHLDMSGHNFVHRTQTLDTTDDALDIANLSSPGIGLFINRSATNNVQIKDASAGNVIPLLKPGEPCMLRFDSSVTAPVATAVGMTISAATNANPVEFTTASDHGLTTGDSVILSGFTGGWTSCNGTFVATVTDTNKFTIAVDSTGFGALSGTPLLVCTTLEYLILED